jgi:hypothetical protein
MAIGTGAALMGSALIGAGSSLFGASKAAKAQKQAAAQQAAQFQESKNLLLPYTAGTTQAQTMYGNAIGANGKDAQSRYYEDFQADPGFQTSLNNSLDETMKRYSIIGRTGGGLANSLMKTGQNALLGAYDKRLSQLGGFVDSGRSAASAIAGFGQQSAAAQGANLANAGMLQGQGAVNAGNAFSGALDNYGLLKSRAAGYAGSNDPFANPLIQKNLTSNRALF